MWWNYYKLRQLSLLQSAMDSYYKLRQLFYYKVRHSLLQIATGITKCDGFITNCDRYYKVWWIYYKLRQVLQNAMIITNCDCTPVSWEICHLVLWKGPKWLKDEFYGFINSKKRSIFVIDSYLKDSAFTVVKRDAKF